MPKKTGQEKRGSPTDSFAGCREMLVLYSNRRAVLQGCERILSYRPEEILFSRADGVVRVRGRGLYCISFSGGCATLGGVLTGVEFPTDGEAGK